MPVLPCNNFKRQYRNTKRIAIDSRPMYTPHGITKVEARKSLTPAKKGKWLIDTFGAPPAFLNNVAVLNSRKVNLSTRRKQWNKPTPVIPTPVILTPLNPRKRRTAEEDDDGSATSLPKRARGKWASSPAKVKKHLFIKHPMHPQLGGRRTPWSLPTPYTPTMLGVLSEIARRWKQQFSGGSSGMITKSTINWWISLFPNLVPNPAGRDWWTVCLSGWVSIDTSNSMVICSLFPSIEFEELAKLCKAVKDMGDREMTMTYADHDTTKDDEDHDTTMDDVDYDTTMDDGLDDMEKDPLGFAHPFFNAVTYPFFSLDQNKLRAYSRQ